METIAKISLTIPRSCLQQSLYVILCAETIIIGELFAVVQLFKLG